jgi:hypothetical protein
MIQFHVVNEIEMKESKPMTDFPTHQQVEKAQRLATTQTADT